MVCFTSENRKVDFERQNKGLKDIETFNKALLFTPMERIGEALTSLSRWSSVSRYREKVACGRCGGACPSP